MTVLLRQVNPPGPALVLPYFDSGGTPAVTGGVGGWTQVQRPQQVAGTRWDGYPLLQWDATPVFAATSPGADVTGPLAQLRAWGVNPKAGAAPPVLQVAGLGYDRARWVLHDLAVVDLARTPDWRPRLSTAKVTLLEFQGLTVRPTAADSVRTQLLSSTTASRVVVVGTGETLRQVAQRYLRDGRRWPEITRLNPSLRDPSKRFTSAHHLTIPAR